ncbi:hypothetical protein O0L34_g14291 [Tuta absoluta]|nr:hypothetical protein O0L34_g14291 [Tuta absoluta]
MHFLSSCLVIFISYIFKSINSNISEYNYEKINRFGAGRRIIPDYRRLNPNKDFGFGREHPDTLPPPKKTTYVRSPYHNIFQGIRRLGDYRVFRQKFDFDETRDVAQRYFCEARLSCIITHMAVRTEGGIPILLRGGVGYAHFYVIARPYSGHTINGTVSAYCHKNENLAARRYQYGIVGSTDKFNDEK